MTNNATFEIIKHLPASFYRFSGAAEDFVPPHFHNDFELFVPFQGSGYCVFNGEHLELSPGDVFLFNPGEVHGFHTHEPPFSWVCLQIHPSFFKPFIAPAERLLFDTNVLRDVLSPNQLSDLSSLVFEFGYQLLKDPPYGRTIQAIILAVLFHFLLSHVPNRGLSEKEFSRIKDRNARIMRAATFVEAHFKEKIFISDLAKMENLSTSYLSTFFKKNFSQTFQDYVDSVRFSYARSLIHSDRRLVDISYEAGFSDPRYLVKSFLRHESCTPTEYRDRFRSAKDVYISAKPGQTSLGPLDDETLLNILPPLRKPLGHFFENIFA